MTIQSERRRRKRLDDAVTRAFTPPLDRLLKREGKRVLAATSAASAIAAVKRSEWVATLTTLWLSDPVLEIWDAQQKRLGTDFTITSAVRKSMGQIAAEHASSIVRTRQDRIRRIVTPEKAADRFRSDRVFRSTRRRELASLYSTVTDQAGSYAFTEALQATETIRYESARNASETAKFRTRKVWFTQGDSLVRPDHGAVNGQSRFVAHRGWGGKPAKFSVGGASLEFPREPGGPPNQVINCRCFLEYRRVRAKK